MSDRPPNFRSTDSCISCKFINLFPPKGLEDHKYFSCKKYETAIINGRCVCDDFNSEEN